MIHCLYPIADRNCSGYLIEIYRILNEAPTELLKQTIIGYIQGADTDNHYRMSEILLDVLPTLSSSEAALALVELIRESKISELRGSLMVEKISLFVKPKPAVIQSLLELFKGLSKESKFSLSGLTLLRQASLLGVGTLTHRLSTMMKSQGKPITEIISFIDTISTVGFWLLNLYLYYDFVMQLQIK